MKKNNFHSAAFRVRFKRGMKIIFLSSDGIIVCDENTNYSIVCTIIQACIIIRQKEDILCHTGFSQDGVCLCADGL